MTSQQQRIAVVGGLTAVVLVGILLATRGTTSAAATVRSDDGALVLTVPPGALPAGTKAEDLRVTKVADAPKQGAAPILFHYRLQPENLTLKKPVAFELAKVPVRGTIPFVFLISADAKTVETPTDLRVTFEKDKTARISGGLGHFSNLVGAGEVAPAPDKVKVEKDGDKVSVTLPADGWLPPLKLDVGKTTSGDNVPDETLTVTWPKLIIEPLTGPEREGPKLDQVHLDGGYDASIGSITDGGTLDGDEEGFWFTFDSATGEVTATRIGATISLVGGASDEASLYKVRVPVKEQVIGFELLDAPFFGSEENASPCPGIKVDPKGKEYQVLKIGDKCYLKALFFASPPDACPAEHYHGGVVESLDNFRLADPEPHGCGFGKVEDVPTVTIKLGPQYTKYFPRSLR
ncbi:MAG TPA: hypothetical protein VL426_00815 [Candidatus Binatia bacterium]|jgi:hypothetical protein|nr:hypothetical protein [Candidatus Binatia bacterium]